MGPYTSWTSCYSGDENETYHCSPACSSDGIIWEGSDAEETPEETQAKRLRYEKEAKRCMRGHLPILQSTSLKGPFDRESGWENPWRYRSRKPRKVEEKEGWWQQSLEGMLFTRENVMKRAANHGLGYLTPSEALAWCKDSANTELEGTHGDIMTSIEPENGMSVHYLPDNRVHDAAPVDRSPMEVAKPLFKLLNLNNRHSSSQDQACLGSVTSNAARGKKRLVSSLWLKGSYISKRARWDGPAFASPTPMPHIPGDRRSQGHSRLNVAQLRPPSRRIISFPQMSPQRLGPDPLPLSGPQTHVPEDRPSGDHVLPKQGHTPSFLDLDNRSLSFQSSTAAPHGQVEDMDEPPEAPQQWISAISFCYGSSFKPQRTPSDKVELSPSSIKSGNLVDATPRDQQTNRTPLTEGIESNAFRNLRHKDKAIIFQAEDSEVIEDVSFISEVAPSCRGLEKFKYRKARRTVHELVDFELEHLRNGEDVPLPESKLPSLGTTSLGRNRSVDRSTAEEINVMNVEDEWNTTMEGMAMEGSDEDVLTPVKEPYLPPEVIGVEAPFPTGAMQLLEDSTTPPRSENSDASWDMIDDLMHSSSLKRTSNVTPVKSIMPKSPSLKKIAKSPTPISVSSRDHNYILVPSDTNDSTPVKWTHHLGPPPTSKHHCLCKSKSNIQSGAQQNLQKMISLDAIEKNRPLNEEDVSTQSANTTPTRSTKTSKNTPSLLEEVEYTSTISSAIMIKQAQGPIADGKRALLYENIEDEMECIQKALSQDCPSISSDESSPTEESISSQGDIHTEDVREEENVVVHTLDIPEITPEPAIDLQSPNVLPDNEEEHLAATASFSVSAEAPISGGRIIKGLPEDDTLLTDFKVKGDAPEPEQEAEDDETPDTPSKASWQRCGTQSPWGAENIELLPNFGHRGSRNEQSLGSEADMSCENSESNNPMKQLEQTEWHHVELPLTPKADGIKPFNNLMTLTVSPVHGKLRTEPEAILSSQLLVDAAMNNPWASILRNANSVKSKKRVSFGILPSGKEENSISDDLEDSPSAREMSNTHLPPETSFSHHVEVNFDDGSAVINDFGGRSTAGRTFKRILPDKTASQMNSSPATIDAMAEAFIAADRDAPIGQEQQRADNRSPIRHYKSSSDIHDTWEDTTAGDASIVQSSGEQKATRADTILAEFDMDEALEEIGEYLEDWSVEAELKKGKEADAREYASSGLRRRKLFGIV